MNKESNIFTLPVLLQASFTDRDTMQPQAVFQVSGVRIRMDQLLNQLDNITDRNRSPLAELNAISYCDLCGSKFRLIINELSGRTDYKVKGFIFCPDCDLTPETPFYLFSAVFSYEGELVPCYCTQCKNCQETSVTGYNDSALCLRCVEKHHLKAEILALSPKPEL